MSHDAVQSEVYTGKLSVYAHVTTVPSCLPLRHTTVAATVDGRVRVLMQSSHFSAPGTSHIVVVLFVHRGAIGK